MSSFSVQLANNFSDEEDERNLGEELLGMEKAQQFKHFCAKVKKFFSCRGCRTKCKDIFKRRKAAGKSDDDEQGIDLESKPVLSPKDMAALEEKNKRGQAHADGAQGGAAAEGTKLHKKNKRRRKHENNLQNQLQGEQEDDEQSQICKLCGREQPLYFYQQEDIIRRMPERALTKLLTQMKQDLMLKLAYLKYLKVSAKFCQPCECPRKRVHTYCQTAHIIRN